MEFLMSNYSLFSKSNNDRRLIKINVMMSRAVKSRSSDQCRSHHQKMMKFHKDIPSIIDYIQGLRASETNTNSVIDDIEVKIEGDQEYFDS
jgi:hypothetical protein